MRFRIITLMFIIAIIALTIGFERQRRRWLWYKEQAVFYHILASDDLMEAVSLERDSELCKKNASEMSEIEISENNEWAISERSQIIKQWLMDAQSSAAEALRWREQAAEHSRLEKEFSSRLW